MAYIHLFKGNVSANALDGIMCSEGTKENPIATIELDASMGAECKPIPVAVRVDAGYKTAGDTKIEPVGDNKSKWALALDSNGGPGDFGAYGAPLVIREEIANANKIVWLKARASADEQPQEDYSVSIAIKTKIVFEL